MYWDIARHPGDVTENGIAAFDDVINHRGETGLDCDFSVTDMVCHLMPSMPNITCLEGKQLTDVNIYIG